jgi:glutaredoxin-related protein
VNGDYRIVHLTALRLLPCRQTAFGCERRDVSGSGSFTSPERRSEMQARANGRHTVPQIFIDDLHIGGCDELYALDRSGKLAAMLAS